MRILQHYIHLCEVLSTPLPLLQLVLVTSSMCEFSLALGSALTWNSAVASVISVGVVPVWESGIIPGRFWFGLSSLHLKGMHSWW